MKANDKLELSEHDSFMDMLTHTSPDTAIERFARNFRNMGVVRDIKLGNGENVLIVNTTEMGMGVQNVREKGHDFQIQDVSAAGEGIDLVIEYFPSEK